MANGMTIIASANVSSTQQQTDTLQNTNESEPEPQRGGISVNGRCYLLCNTIGKGGSAEVFRVQALPTEGEEKERLDGIVSDLGAISSKTNSDDVAGGAISSKTNSDDVPGGAMSSKTNSDDVAGDSAAADSAAADSAATAAVTESQSGDLPTTDNGNEHNHDSDDCLQYLNKQRSGPVPHELYALKIVFARSQEEFDQFFNEVKLLYQCQNQHNVIQMLDFETNPSCFGIFMVMELASQGDLFHYLRDHADSLRLCGDPYILVEGGNVSAESVGVSPLAEDNEHADGSETQIEESEKKKTEANPVANGPAKIYIETNNNLASENSGARPSEKPSKLPELNLSSVTAQFRPGSEIKVSLDDIADQTSIAPREKRSLGSSSSQAKLHHSDTQSTRTPDLSHSCLRKEKISLEELDNRCRSVLSLFTQSLTGVRSLHEKKIIHSDLKPANFLVCEQAFRIDTSTVDGRALAAFLGMPDDASTVMLSVVKVADLGLAAVVREGDSHVTRGNLIGTQQFMAPEAIFRMKDGTGAGLMEGVETENETEGHEIGGVVGEMLRKTALREEEQEPRFDKTKIRYASDVWSMGVILFLMMYQRTPYAHLRRLGHCLWMVMLDESVAIQFQPCMLGNISQEFERLVQICQGCLQHKPTDRWNVDRIFEEISRDLTQSPYNLDLSPTLQVRGTGTLVEIETYGPRKLNPFSAAALGTQSSTATGNNDTQSVSGNKSTTDPSNSMPAEPSNTNLPAVPVTAPENSTPVSTSRPSQNAKKCLVDCRFVTIVAVVASICVVGLIFGALYGVMPSLRSGASGTPGLRGTGNNVTKNEDEPKTEEPEMAASLPEKTATESESQRQAHRILESQGENQLDATSNGSDSTAPEKAGARVIATRRPSQKDFLKPIGKRWRNIKLAIGSSLIGVAAAAAAVMWKYKWTASPPATTGDISTPEPTAALSPASSAQESASMTQAPGPASKGPAFPSVGSEAVEETLNIGDHKSRQTPAVILNIPAHAHSPQGAGATQKSLSATGKSKAPAAAGIAIGGMTQREIECQNQKRESHRVDDDGLSRNDNSAQSWAADAPEWLRPSASESPTRSESPAFRSAFNTDSVEPSSPISPRSPPSLVPPRSRPPTPPPAGIAISPPFEHPDLNFNVPIERESQEQTSAPASLDRSARYRLTRELPVRASEILRRIGMEERARELERREEEENVRRRIAAENDALSRSDGSFVRRRDFSATTECSCCLSAMPEVNLTACGHKNMCLDCLHRHFLTSSFFMCPHCRKPIIGWSLLPGRPRPENFDSIMSQNEVLRGLRQEGFQD